jgi:hypothetical protein
MPCGMSFSLSGRFSNTARDKLKQCQGRSGTCPTTNEAGIFSHLLRHYLIMLFLFAPIVRFLVRGAPAPETPRLF